MDDSYKEKYRYHGNNPGFWEKDKIRAKNAGYCPARPYNWNDRSRADQELDQCGNNSREEIKKEVFYMPQPVFNIFSKYIEEKHIPGNMHPARVQEDGSKEGV